MTFAQIVTVIEDYCNLHSTEATTRIGKSVNRHYRRITSELGLNTTRFVTRSVSMTVGVRAVVFPEIEKIDRVIDTTDSTAIRLLTEVSQHTQRTTQPSESEPTTWSLQNTDADSVTILTDTTPQTAYSLQADGWVTLSDLSGSDEPVFPESFHDVMAWYVIAEELLKKEKDKLAGIYEGKATTLLAALRFYLADSPTLTVRARNAEASSLPGGGSGGGGTLGGTAYTQTSLLTFDLGPGVAPFAVDEATSLVVTNLDADKLDGQHGTYYLDRANHTGAIPSTGITLSASDRLVGRDTASGGASEEISVTGGIEFTGSQSIRTTAFTGDVTKSAGGTALTIANGAVTYAKMQDVSATDKLLGRSTSGSGDVEEITCTAAGRALLDDAAASNQRTTLGVGTGDSPTFTAITLSGGQVVFPASQNASSNANTLDDYEEGTWTPADGSGAALSFSNVEGFYVKEGQLVVTGGAVTFPSTVSAASVVISGLPFAIQDTTADIWVGTVIGDSGTAGGSPTAVGANNGTTFAVRTGASDVAIQNADFSTNTMRFTLSYRATA